MRTRLGGIAFLSAAVAYLLAETVAAAAWVSPRYDYAMNYISDLGVPGCGIEYSGRYLCSPFAPLMNAGFIVDGVLFMVASFLLARHLSRRWRGIFLTVAVLHGVGNVIVGLFDETTGSLAAGLPHTHVIGATLAILFGNVTAIVAGSWGIRAGHRIGWVALALGIVGVIAFAVLAVDGLGMPEGLVERVAVYPITSFELLAGAVAVLASGRMSARTVAGPLPVDFR
ncbi:MAG: DUF998 domain-containing protein [Salinibacterium sp.]|nr:DUF998 domain-containing protein [Salinibacterium sp.]